MSSQPRPLKFVPGVAQQEHKLSFGSGQDEVARWKEVSGDRG
jgi:hypothetical protein